MANNPYIKYQERAINTATPEELTLMLYNGCIKFMNIAELAMQEKDVSRRNLNLQKAQAIVTELSITLNMETEIAQNLRPLYDFVHYQLVEANIHNDLAALDHAKKIVTDLRDAWKEAMGTSKSNL